MLGRRHQAAPLLRTLNWSLAMEFADLCATVVPDRDCSHLQPLNEQFVMFAFASQ